MYSRGRSEVTLMLTSPSRAHSVQLYKNSLKTDSTVWKIDLNPQKTNCVVKTGIELHCHDYYFEYDECCYCDCCYTSMSALRRTRVLVRRGTVLHSLGRTSEYTLALKHQKAQKAKASVIP